MAMTPGADVSNDNVSDSMKDQDISTWLHAMNLSIELVFGSGKYGCLGKKIAFLELNKVFAEIFFRFDFIDPQKGFKSRCNGMFMQSEMNVIVQRRAT